MKVTIAVLVVFTSCLAQGKKITITNFEDCEPNADYPVKMSFKLKEENGQQVVEEGLLSSKIDLGNNIKDIAEVYSKEDGKYEHVVTINENLCDALNKYMGEFMHEMQKAAGLEAGTCPVPAGDYKINDHALDFSKFKFKRVPEGEFRVKVSLQNSTNDQVLHCHNVDFTIEP